MARVFRGLSLVLLLLAVASFAIASGVFIRDFTGSGFGGSVSLEPRATFTQNLYVYELTYDLGVFATVNVTTVVEAAYTNWSVTFQSNGSLLTTFRPPLPGVLTITITNQEDRRGELGYNVLQGADLPPELETSLLNPALYTTLGLLVASVFLFALGPRLKRGKAA
ncbi:MAG: hypothetical protein ACE5I4_07840 [Thermoplasmata archaeon]